MRAALLGGLLVLAAGGLASPAQAARLAYVGDTGSGTDIFAVDDNGSARQNLTNSSADEFSPAWSPDGGRIAFTRGLVDEAQVWVMAADGSGAASLTQSAGGSDPAWSPDSARIAFVSQRTGAPELYVMNADGSGAVQLTTTGGVAGPAWSPDGARIAYWSELDSRIHLIGADGTGDGPVGGEDGVLDRDPAWAPDGTLAFTLSRDQGNVLDVWRMAPDGSDRRRLVATAARETESAWSSAGRLAFSADREGQYDIYIANADGTAPRPLTDGPGDETAVTWAPDAGVAAPTGGPAVTGPGGGAAVAPRATFGRRRARVRVFSRSLQVVVPYRLTAAARVTIEVRLRGRLVARLVRNGRRGYNVAGHRRRIAGPRRWRGRYVISVTEVRPGPPAGARASRR
jgi:TolB protein